ncbi:MAG: hypothetical protein AAFV33_02305 [Chloroflexota bacterium]
MVTLRSTAVVVLWLLFIVTFVRALMMGHLSQSSGRRLWLMFFLSVLACTFWGEAAEMQLDRHFRDLPVALYLKYFCLVGVCHLYWQLLQDVVELPASTHWLNGVIWAAGGAAIASWVDYALRSSLSRDDLRYIVIGARDSVISLYIFAGFFRGTRMLLRRERVAAMRLKQTAILCFFTSFVITALGSTSAGVMTILGIGDPQSASEVLQPFLYPTLFFFVVMLIPYRWYSAIPSGRNLWRYYRLKRVERRIFRLAETQPNINPQQWFVFQSGLLELSVYRTLISILDGYPMLDGQPQGKLMFEAVRNCVSQSSSYDELVQSLGACVDVRPHS